VCTARLGFENTWIAFGLSLPLAFYLKKSWPLMVGFVGGSLYDMWQWRECVTASPDEIAAELKVSLPLPYCPRALRFSHLSSSDPSTSTCQGGDVFSGKGRQGLRRVRQIQVKGKVKHWSEWRSFVLLLTRPYCIVSFFSFSHMKSTLRSNLKLDTIAFYSLALIHLQDGKKRRVGEHVSRGRFNSQSQSQS